MVDIHKVFPAAAVTDSGGGIVACVYLDGAWDKKETNFDRCDSAHCNRNPIDALGIHPRHLRLPGERKSRHVSIRVVLSS